MSVVGRRRAAAPPRGMAPSSHQGSRYRRQPPALPGRPGGSCSTHHQLGVPIYLSFVSKAILWDRKLCHYTARDLPYDCPSLCPRFLSHMKVHPEDHRPPCFQNSKSRRPPLFQGKMSNAFALAAPKTQTLDGSLNLKTEDRRRKGLNQERRPVLLPHLPVPPTPLLPTFIPTLPPQNTPPLNSEGPKDKVDSDGTSPSNVHPPVEGNTEVQAEGPLADVVSLSDSTKLHPNCAEPVHSPSPPSTLSHGSLSDLSQSPSSVFSRSIKLSGRVSGLSADTGHSDPEPTAFSPLQPCLRMGSPLVSRSSPTSTCSSVNIPNTSPVLEPIFGQLDPLSSHSLQTQLNKQIRPEGVDEPSGEASVSPVSHPLFDSDYGLATLAFPSTTWSSCPSPQTTTPRSGSEPGPGPGPGPTSSASVARLESHRWPVLPPITPDRGCCSSASSRSSQLSRSQSHMFDELEAIAPPSPSCPSVCQPSDSSRSSSPDAGLSPGLAALTVGCHSGNLSSISRVQLLLLDRLKPEDEELSPLHDWSCFRMQGDAGLTSSGAPRPLTAGSVSERWDPADGVLENKSDECGPTSSWITDQTPSRHSFWSAACSPCGSRHGSSTGDQAPNYPGGRDGVEASVEGRGPDSRAEEDPSMEERKRKAMNLLSQLHNDAPHLPGPSNFEDFDFLAKYCIFSPEKLSEYKRAFEEADSDGDGHISCLQALLALKNIVPAELLSDEEEIYVYRILELVDFRVTDGLVDLRLFAVISSLAQKIATMDEFMRSLISNMDFRSLEVRLFNAKQLFLFLLDEEERGDAAAAASLHGLISPEQLLLELRAGGIRLEREATVLRELRHIPPLDLLDFLAHLPLFMLIHNSVISNPLNDA